MPDGGFNAKDLKELNEALAEKFKEVGDHLKRNQDAMDKALEEVRKEGTIHAKTNDELKKLGETSTAAQAEMKKMSERLLDMEQKLARRPGGTGEEGERQSAGQIIATSDQYKAMIASKDFKMAPVTVQRKTILNATGQNQPLVPADRQAGIIMPGLRRLTIRDLLPQIRTTSNLIEFCRELVFTNNAAPQYDNTSPDPHAEGAAKAESNITFELATAPIIVIAHWIGASRQVLGDAPQLAGYIDSRLEYGLKLEEEDELLNADGTAGQLNGLMNQATAFNGGNTNATALDTLLRAFLQVSLAYYESSGVVLHPTDWHNIVMLKDTTGRYLFADPQSMAQPRVWGKPVVATPSQTLGQFLTGAFDLACSIYDREDVSIRVSDQHSDFFTKNLVAILCEERVGLAVYRPAALVKGAVSHAG